MNSKTFPFKAIRTWAPSRITGIGAYGRSRCVPCEGQEYTTTTYHRTKASAERTAKSSTQHGYVGILKSGRVEPNTPE